jgi:PAS domain S-box-containing protein
MSPQLRILILEDNENDAELIVRELRHSGLDFLYKHIGTPDKFLSALEEESWDIILSDYNLPQFNTLEALKLLDEHNIDIPFIIVSGSIGEKLAVEIMKAGADDYIMKNNLIRLGPAVEKEVKAYTEQKRAEAALREQDRIYREAITQAGAVPYKRDYLTEKLTFFGKGIEKLTGYSAEELTSEIMKGLIKEVIMRGENAGFSEKEASQRVRSGQVSVWEADYRIQARNGETRWFSDSSVRLFDPQGKPIGSMGILQDITERKLAIKEIVMLSHAIQSVNECISITDNDNTFLYVNDAFLKTYGYERNELIGKKTSILGLGETPEKMAEVLEATLKGGWQGELTNIKKDGTKFPIFLSTSVIRDDNNEAIALIGVARDITERKHAEETLREQDRIYRESITQAGAVPYKRYYLSDKYIFLGEGIKKLTGYTEEELTQKIWKELIQEVIMRGENAGFSEEEAVQRVRSRKVSEWKADYRIKTRNGEIHWFSDSSVQLLDSAGKAIGSLGILQDITERKLAEGEITKLKLGIERSGDAVFVTDLDGKFTYVNSTFEKIYGYTQQEVKGESPKILKSGSHSNEFYKKFWDTLLSKQEFKGEIVNKTKEGKTVDMEVTVNPIIDLSGSILGFMAIQRDITERKRIEQKIIENESKLSALFESAGYSISVAKNGVQISGNPAFMKLFGYNDTSEFIGKSLLETIAPEERERISKYIADRAKGLKVPTHYETKGLRRDGSIFDMDVQVSTYIFNNESYTVGFQSDITERKKSEEGLKLFRSLMNQTNDSIEVIDPETGQFLDVNEKCCSELGYTREELLSMKVSDIDLSVGDSTFRNDEREVRKIGYARFETIHRRKNGTTFPVEVNLKYVQLDRGYLVNVVRNITERKRVEKVQGILASLAKKLGEVTTPKEVAHIVMSAADGLFGWDACILNLYHENEKLTEPILFIDTIDGRRKEFPSELPTDVLSPTFQRVLKEGPLLILRNESDLKKEGEHIRFGNKDRKSASLMYVPVRKQTENIGFLSIQSYTPNAYEQKDLELLQTLADHCSGALERTFAEQGRQLQLQRITALRNIDMAIASSLDLKVTLNIIQDQVIQQLNVDAVDILLMNPDTHFLEYAAGRGFHTLALQQTHLRLGEGLAGKTILERKIHYIPNLRKEENSFAQSPLFKEEGFISYYCVPLIAKGLVKGALEIFHRKLLVADFEWLDYLNILAGQAAIAIDSSDLFTRLQYSNSELLLSYDTTIEGWSAALDLRDNETEGHTLRVTELTLDVARVMGIREEELIHIRRGALLHDIGKMGIPDNILLKPGPLTDEEWVIMKKHPVYAYNLLYPIAYLRPALDIPYCHHEKWDGTGYPRGLKGEMIPLSARIFAVIDVWDALLSDRPYRKAWPKQKVLEHIKAGSGSHFDPRILELFIKIVM